MKHQSLKKSLKNGAGEKRMSRDLGGTSVIKVSTKHFTMSRCKTNVTSAQIIWRRNTPGADSFRMTNSVMFSL